MEKITINGQQYNPADPVPWDTACEVGGFYFTRAQHLGLPEPPAAFVVEDQFDDQPPEWLEIIGNYHKLYQATEAAAAG